MRNSKAKVCDGCTRNLVGRSRSQDQIETGGGLLGRVFPWTQIRQEKGVESESGLTLAAHDHLPCFPRPMRRIPWILRTTNKTEEITRSVGVSELHHKTRTLV